MGLTGCGGNGWGVQSIDTLLFAVLSCDANGEFRRLTMRGERLLSVRVAFSLALA